MASFIEQPITHFCKINLPHRLSTAFHTGDVREYILTFFYLTVTENHECRFLKSTVQTLEALTAWKKNSIDKALRKLIADGELERVGHKGVRLNPRLANKQKLGRFESKYEGKEPVYSKSQLEMLERLQQYIPQAYKLSRPEKLNVEDVLIQIDQMEKQNLIIKDHLRTALGFLRDDDLPKAKEYLRLVLNEDD